MFRPLNCARQRAGRKTRRRRGGLAIALVLDGWSREAAAEACAMDRQTLRDLVHRYNESGLEGLTDRPRRNGPRPRLSAEQRAKVAEWVEQGPDFERDGVVRWRCVDLQRRILKEFAVSLHERTVASCCASCRSDGYRCARSTRKPSPKNKRFSEQLCRSHDRGAAARGGGQAGRNMVHRRSPCWAAGDTDPCVGATWVTPSCTA